MKLIIEMAQNNTYEDLLKLILTTDELNDYNNMSNEDLQEYLKGFQEAINTYNNLLNNLNQAQNSENSVSNVSSDGLQNNDGGGDSSNDANNSQLNLNGNSDLNDNLQSNNDDSTNGGQGQNQNNGEQSEADDLGQNQSNDGQSDDNGLNGNSSNGTGNSELSSANGLGDKSGNENGSEGDGDSQLNSLMLDSGSMNAPSSGQQSVGGQPSGGQEGPEQAGNQIGQSSMTIGNGNSQSNKSNNQQPIDPDGEFEIIDIDYSDFDFSGNDMSADGESLHEKMKRLALEAGQDLDSDDYQDPILREKELFDKVKKELKQKPHGRSPFGNSLLNLHDTISSLFASNIDWKTILRSLFNSLIAKDRKMAMSKRRMGVDSDHPLYKGRYMHPHPIYHTRRDGITQVFYMIDNSGSMGFDSMYGQELLKHLFSEIIEIERKTNIQNSALAYYGCSKIDKNTIRRWNAKQYNNKQGLLSLICRRVGDQGGGTSFENALLSLYALGEPYYSKKPETLIIDITDGEDDFRFAKDLTPKLKETIIFLVVNRGSYLNVIKNKLIETGINPHHILTVDIEKEWGL